MDYEWAVKKVITYIEQHLHEPITMEEIAEEAGFSKFHFHRIFQNNVKMSMTEYIRQRRLANASAALLYSDERIIDIAIYYQFDSQEAFTRAFKKMYQLPPGQYRKLMRDVMKNKEESAVEETQIKGWFISGSDPFSYEMGVDHKVFHQGKASGYLKSMAVLDSTQFATMMQQFKADHYIGKRIRLSCFIKTDNVKSFASMWMRVDDHTSDMLQFDNMSNRPITGTTNWSRYSIVLDVPDNSAVIAFGIILSGQGQVWADQFSFQEVDDSVPTTNLEIEGQMQDEPVNLSFEE